MEIVVAFIAMAMIVVVAAYIAQPLLVKSRTGVAGDSEGDLLIAERDRIYTAIRDLDMDFQTGKLVEADYRSMRETYTARGVEILKQLDAFAESAARTNGSKSKAGARRRAPASAVQAEAIGDIEVAVQARRRAKASAVQDPAEDDVEAEIRARRQTRQPARVSTGTCPSCGNPVDPTDQFCAKCGTQLNVEAVH